MKFLIRHNIEYSLLVEADDAEKAEAKADEVPLANYDTAKSSIEVERYFQKQLYKCLKCGNPTAEKQPDHMGWDGYCSKCGMIAQEQVGEPVNTCPPDCDHKQNPSCSLSCYEPTE